MIVPTFIPTTNLRTRYMGICERAKIELERAGWNTDPEKHVKGDPFTNGGIHILNAVEAFFKAGWSGGSVGFGINILHRLVQGLPLTQLTGEDDEWEDRSEPTGSTLFQNKRDTTVFKAEDGRPFSVAARAFTYPSEIDDSEPGNYSQYTHEYITFPYMPQPPTEINLPSSRYDCDRDELGLIVGEMAQRTKVRNLMRRKFVAIVHTQYPELEKLINLRMSDWHVSKVNALEDSLTVEVTTNRRGTYVISDALTDELIKRIPLDQMVDVLMEFKGTESPTFASDCVSATKE